MSRTFAAVSTAPYNAALGIVRLCGKDAIKIADKVFMAADRLAISKASSHTVHYGKIVTKDGETVDRVMATVLLAPATFSGLDTVEFTCHGGVIVLSRVFETLIEAGAKPAQPGEFTKTAFLNGKIDLAESESIIDLINAKSEAAARIASAAVGGTLSKRVKQLRAKLIASLSHISAFVDFAHEDIVRLDESELLKELITSKQQIDRMVTSYAYGRAVTEGVPAAIVGRPNVGKSSLMNLLYGGERSIVTEYSGTTRDVVTETARAGDVLLKLSDTAGIRESDDTIEKIGIEKSKQQINSAELVLAVFDGSKPPNEDDLIIIDLTCNKNSIAVINKCDTPPNKELYKAVNAFERRVIVSAKTGQGYETLVESIVSAVSNDSYMNETVVINARHHLCLKEAAKSLQRAIEALSFGEHSDIAEIDITEAAEHLGDITGEAVKEDVINDIFSRFCVGK